MDMTCDQYYAGADAVGGNKRPSVRPGAISGLRKPFCQASYQPPGQSCSEQKMTSSQS